MNKRTNDYTYLGRSASQQIIDANYTEVVNQQKTLLQKTYLLLAASFVPCALGVVVATSFNLVAFLAKGGSIASILMIVGLYALMFAIQRFRYSKIGIGLLFTLTFFLGVLLTPLLQVALHSPNGGKIVLVSALMTAGTFFVMSLLAHSSKINSSGLASFLSVGMIVLVITMLVSFFVQTSALFLALSGGFVLFSSLLILWQTKVIIEGGETSYISAALNIFISLYNLFTSLLNIIMLISGSGRN